MTTYLSFILAVVAPYVSSSTYVLSFRFGKGRAILCRSDVDDVTEQYSVKTSMLIRDHLQNIANLRVSLVIDDVIYILIGWLEYVL